MNISRLSPLSSSAESSPELSPTRSSPEHSPTRSSDDEAEITYGGFLTTYVDPAIDQVRDVAKKSLKEIAGIASDTSGQGSALGAAIVVTKVAGPCVGAVSLPYLEASGESVSAKLQSKVNPIIDSSTDSVAEKFRQKIYQSSDKVQEKFQDK